MLGKEMNLLVSVQKDSEGDWFVASRRDCSEYELMFKFLQWLDSKEGFSFITKKWKRF